MCRATHSECVVNQTLRRYDPIRMLPYEIGLLISFTRSPNISLICHFIALKIIYGDAATPIEHVQTGAHVNFNQILSKTIYHST